MPDVTMPKLSDTMTEGTLVKWVKKKGESVEIGDVIAEVETDKATMEMEAFDEGTLVELYVHEGEKVDVGDRIAYIQGEDEQGPSAEQPDTTPATNEPPIQSEELPAETSSAPTTSSSTNSGIKASPLARKIAKETGIDLATISGSGPGGRIVAADLEGARSGGATTPRTPVQKTTAETSAPKSGLFGTGASLAAPEVIRPIVAANDERILLSGMRKTIADRLLTAKTTIPHFYLHIEVNAAPLLELRQQINATAEKEQGHKFTINDFVLKAVASAAQATPAANASFDNDAIVRFAEVNLAVAVALEEGLVTPVIRSAQDKSLLAISREMKDLADRARHKKLKPEEYAGGTITISNLGGYGIDFFDAIINPPQSVILSIGSIRKVPVVNERDEIVVGTRMDIGLSGDHRVIDGAVGAAFLAALRQRIEQPALMLM